MYAIVLCSSREKKKKKNQPHTRKTTQMPRKNDSLGGFYLGKNWPPEATICYRAFPTSNKFEALWWMSPMTTGFCQIQENPNV